MGKGKAMNITRYGVARVGDDRQRCIKCGVPIVYGERCPTCEQQLRKRRRRKPR